MLDPVGLYGPVRGAAAQRKTGPSGPSSGAGPSGDKEGTGGTVTPTSPVSQRASGVQPAEDAPRQQDPKSAKSAAAAAAKRERLEWERTRGAGSSVLLWYEDVRVNNPSELDHFGWTAPEVVPPLAKVLARSAEPVEVVGMDRLLDWGICDYTMLPRTLGRGRFSTVYLALKNGEKFAVKHTPLFPHHELVATRLLREPTLLAELPPHPNLVKVVETIRTPGHFYLVEEFLEGYVTLEALIPRLSTTKPPKAPVLPLAAAEKIFSQLVLVLHAIHWPLRVCHRDVKPENVLVHPETLHLKLLDFGLATHFSKSRAKLTTCCGSPAFHCPEIVTALTQPPGSVSYWGPEVDAWTCGVTLLRCLSGIRYPLGTSHATPQAMASRAKRVLQTLPAHPLRDQIARLLDLNGEKRMKNFQDIAQHYLAQQTEPLTPIRRELKSTSFVPNMPQHSMMLPLVLKSDPAVQTPPGTAQDVPTDGAGAPAYTKLTLLNPTKQHNMRVLSFIKYCFRCAGILYHTLPESDERATQRLRWQAALGGASAGSVPTTPFGDPNVTSRALECVVELTQDEAQGPFSLLVQSVLSMFGQKPKPEPLVIMPPRSTQTPGTALPSPGKDEAVRPSSGPSGKQGPLKMLVFNVWVSFAQGDVPDADMIVPEVFLHGPHNEAPSHFPSHPPKSHKSHAHFVEEPGLHIDTRPERLPQPVSTPSSPITRIQSPSATRRGSRRGTSRPNAVHVYISDPRAVPYVRGALSNGGVHKPEVPPEEPRRPSVDRGLGHLRNAPVSSPLRSGTTTPGGDESMAIESFSADELVASLDAIEGACRATLLLRTRDSDTTGSARSAENSTARARAHRLYRLVFRLFTQLESTLSNAMQCDALRGQMAELNFRALDVLSPALSLVGKDDSLPSNEVHMEANFGAESGEERAASTGSLSLAVLELFARNSSAKEMCLGIQEQIERLSTACQSRKSSPVQGESEDDCVAPLMRNEAMLVQAIFGLLQLLSVVFPEIETRKPKAVLEPIVSLLYPRLFCKVLPFSLGRIDDADTQEELATQAVMLLCEIIVSIRAFCKHHRRGHEDELAELPDLGNVLIDSLASLLSVLPHTGNSPSTDRDARLLSLSLYDAHQADECSTQNVSERVTVWNVVRKTYDQLDLDLGERCLGAPLNTKTTVELEEETARHALELLVQQLAYETFMAHVKGRTRDRLQCRTQYRTYLGEPLRWSADIAREMLHRLGSVLPAVLVPGLSLAYVPPSPETMKRTQDVQETDAILAFVFWSLNALDRSKPAALDEECATYVVRALALLATFSPVPRLRHVAFSLVTRIVRDYTPAEAALRLMHEMLVSETPSPLRASGVNLLREMCRAHIERLEEARAVDAGSDPLLSQGRLWNMLHDVVFVFPDAPQPDRERETALGELAAYLSQYDSYLLECCTLYYFVRTRDVQNYTGLAEPLLAGRIQERFVDPLTAWVAAWEAHGDLPPELLTQLRLLGSSLERLSTTDKEKHEAP